jgi:hypothetical protein
MFAMGKTLIESERRIPVVAECDVAIVGGGIAGVAAALAAARNGASTLIIEKETSLGGLATLGLIVLYLPLCDGFGNQVVGGLGEELLKNSMKDGPGEIPECWKSPDTKERRREERYELQYNAASFVISLEELVLDNDIEIMFDARFSNVSVSRSFINAVIVETKSGRVAISCRAVVDASGDADVCYAAGEDTICVDTNRRCGWFYSYDGKNVVLHQLSDPLYEAPPAGNRLYSGIEWRDITAHNLAGRRMIMTQIEKMKAEFGKNNIYPLVLPTISQFRMTRRLRTCFELDEANDKQYFADAIGMTGDWRRAGPIFYLPYRCLRGERTANLITAGRCISTTDSAWDITRVIPPCAVTGQAAGTASALLVAGKANSFLDLNISLLQNILISQGVLIDRSYATR